MAGRARVEEQAFSTLREFRNFAHVVRRAADEPCDAWWTEPVMLPTPSSSSSASPSSSEACGPFALICLRGEDMINRFRTFLSREWQLPAATAGQVFFAPNRDITHRTWRAFFSGLLAGGVPPPFEPSLPMNDLRSGLRFENGITLDEASLFPSKLEPQITACVLVPPSVDNLLFRVLTSVEQQGFTLCTAVVGGGLSQALAKQIFEQEVADGHLLETEWEEFASAVGCKPGASADDDDDDYQFRCLWIVLSRHQAVRKCSQLLGHGNPMVNQKNYQACLRLGRDHIQNGIRCPTSLTSAKAVLDALAPNLSPWLQPPASAASDDGSSGRCLGVEASGSRTVECTLAVVALLERNGGDISLAQLLKEIHGILQEKKLTMVGLRALGPLPAAVRASTSVRSTSKSSEASAVANAWPRAASSETEIRAQLTAWTAQQPNAVRVGELLGQPDAGSYFVVVACEGVSAAMMTRQALTEALGPCGGGTTSPSGNARSRIVTPGATLSPITQVKDGELEWYASASGSEATADVTHFFHELFGGRHYVVD